LIVGDVSRELIRALRPLAAKIRRRDRALADQLVRAASSIALNIFEAGYSDGGNKRSRLFTASGSANETRGALFLATRLELPQRGRSKASRGAARPRHRHALETHALASTHKQAPVAGPGPAHGARRPKAEHARGWASSSSTGFEQPVCESGLLLLELTVKRAAIEAEHLGGERLVTTDRGEHLTDVALFDDVHARQLGRVVTL
jgi:four helix bundle protein